MAITQLSAEQVATFTREQKDRFWLDNVYRGDMPQLTLRSALTGFCLGGLLSLTNLYVGAKTGWTLGVGITSVILAFALFKGLTRLGARDMTLLENNAMQSVATAAGYMTMPLVSGLAAFMMVENRLLPWWQMLTFNLVLSVMGVLVAFPLKRRFINDEQQPFPEGQACGVVLDTLYSSSANVGLYKAKVLATFAAGAGFLKFISGENIMQWLQMKVIGLRSFWHLPENLDAAYYWMVGKGWLPVPRLAGVDVRQLGLSPSLDLAMVGAGGLMGVRAAVSMFVGMVLNFCVIVPIMISVGEIRPKADGTFSRIHVLNTWSLWWGITIMVVASLTALFAKPQVFISAFRGLVGRKDRGSDVLRKIELPVWISLVGVPLLGGLGVFMINTWFGVSWGLGLLAIPMTVILAMISANATALTGITPGNSLSKIPQFLFGSLNPGHPPTNLMTALMSVEVSSNASNLLMDIKPGYMLGAKPRQQAVGHMIGIVAGALVATPLFYVLFLSSYKTGGSVQDALVTDQYGFPGAMQWKGVSDLVTAVFSSGKSMVPTSAVWSIGIAAFVGLLFEVLRTTSKGRFPLSPLAIGLGVVVPPDSTMAMFAGAVFFRFMHRRYLKAPQSRGFALWIETHEPICAGLIAGAALVGIADALVKAFLLG
jgi:OPT family oligopeptide transporter